MGISSTMINAMCEFKIKFEKLLCEIKKNINEYRAQVIQHNMKISLMHNERS